MILQIRPRFLGYSSLQEMQLNFPSRKYRLVELLGYQQLVPNKL